MILLDAFCCAGGATRGYQDAGFTVVGVDNVEQPNYCGDDFYLSDAVDFITDYAKYFDVVHASPPCQSHTALTKGTNFGRTYADFIPQTRQALQDWGGRSVIENVQGSTVRRDLMLCGEMFGLAVIRHRYFEFSGTAAPPQPAHPKHRGRVAGMRHGQWFTGPYFAVYGEGGGKGTVPQWQQAMGITWTDVRKEIAEAIPPSYTQLIGTHFAEQLAA